jgi:hypothetical protein
MTYRKHDRKFTSSREVISALVAVLEKAVKGKLDPVDGRWLIGEARRFIAEQDRKISILRAHLNAKDAPRQPVEL